MKQKEQLRREAERGMSLWQTLVRIATSIILSKRILWGPNPKKAIFRKKSNTFLFPQVDHISSVVTKVLSLLKKEDKTNVKTTSYYVDVYVEGEEKRIVSPQKKKKARKNKEEVVGFLSKELQSKPVSFKCLKLLERWKFCREENTQTLEGLFNRDTLTYKKATMLMRGLYAYLLLLPCHKLYKKSQRNRLKYLKMKWRIYSEKDRGKYKYSNVEDVSSTDKTGIENGRWYQFPKIQLSFFSISVGVQYKNEIDFKWLYEQSQMLRKKEEIISGRKRFSSNDDEYKTYNRTMPIHDRKNVGLQNVTTYESREYNKIGIDNESLSPKTRKRASSLASKNIGKTKSIKIQRKNQEVPWVSSPPFKETPNDSHFSFGKTFDLGKQQLDFSPVDGGPSSVGNNTSSFLSEKFYDRRSNVSEVEFNVDQFSPESVGKKKKRLLTFSPPFLDSVTFSPGRSINDNFSVDLIDRSIDSPISIGDENESGLAFLEDDDGIGDMIGQNEEETLEIAVGKLLKSVQNAPVLSAFYSEDGTVKTTNMGDVLERLEQLSKMSGEIMGG